MPLLKKRVRVLVVCRANICRSPMAEAILKQRLKEHGMARSVKVTSAGTAASMPGHKPDKRVLQVAAAEGVRVNGIRARQIATKDLVGSDYLLAMDRQNLDYLTSHCPPGHEHKIALIMDYALSGSGLEVPDPYFGSLDDFRQAFRLIDEASAGLIEHLLTENVGDHRPI